MRAIVFLLLAGGLFAQNEFRLDLSGEWCYRGDDRAEYASPGYDDSAWETRTLPRGARRERSGEEISWLRRSVTLSPAVRELPLSLTLGIPRDVYELFVNGRRIPTPAALDALEKAEMPQARTYDLPIEAIQRQPVVIALRIRNLGIFPPRWVVPDRGPYELSSRNIAPRKAGRLQLTERFLEQSPRYVIGAALAMLGLFGLIAWFVFRDRFEFLWFAAWMFLAGGVNLQGGLALVTNTNEFSHSGITFRYIVLVVSAPAAGATFALSAFSEQRKWLWIVPWVSALLLPVTKRWFPQVSYNVDDAIFLAAGCVIVSGLSNWRRVARWPDRAFILAVLLAFAPMVWNVAQGKLIGPNGGQRDIPVGAFLVSPTLLGSLLTGIVLVILLFWRIAADRREQTRLADEIESARRIQSLLSPEAVQAGGEWRIEASYQPAREVGGDFYQIADRPDGSQVVLVGDVSGKGLEAAMVASVAVGAFRSADLSSPAAILRIMNRALTGHGRSGFVTCLCARFDGGRVTIANAGHPAPYCDGQEVEAAAGLPLGLTADASYSESDAAGEQFTFVSDGVVEAADAKGELFGFERTRAISGQGAHEIADAARAWGQNDDITVVTVRRAA